MDKSTAVKHKRNGSEDTNNARTTEQKHKNSSCAKVYVSNFDTVNISKGINIVHHLVVLYGGGMESSTRQLCILSRLLLVPEGTTLSFINK